MENFNFPYIYKSVQEFWTKWHISLSSWLKDYVYIPLGGGRVSNFRRYFNIFITFFVSGLWHGSNITYIVWGTLHAFYQIIERIIGKYKKDIYINNNFVYIKIFINFILVDFAWIFFRASSIGDAWYIITHLFIFNGFNITLQKNSIMFIIFGLLILLIVEYILYSNKYKGNFTKTVSSDKIKWITIFILIMLVLIMKPVKYGEFIYGMF